MLPNKALQLTPNSWPRSERSGILAAAAQAQRWRSALFGAAERRSVGRHDRMQFLTREASAEWCATNGFDVDRGSPKQPSGPSEKFEIPSDAGRRVALARLLWESVAGSAPRALLWVTEFGVWPSGEHRPLAESARAAWGAPGALAAYPGQLVAVGEHDDGLSGLVLATLFLWDCWLLPAGGSRAAFVSHDEFGIASFREEPERTAFSRKLEWFRG